MLSQLFARFLLISQLLDGGSAVNNCCLTINVHSLKNSNGVVALTIYNQEDGYPESEDKAFKSVLIPIKEGKATVKIDNIPFGEYAIAFLHDENKNGKMDTNFMGIPKEGFGASNNAPIKFGPPKYKDAKFVLDQQKVTVEMKARYL